MNNYLLYTNVLSELMRSNPDSVYSLTLRRWGVFGREPTGGFANYEAAKGFALAGLEAAKNPVFSDSLDFPNAF